VVERCYFDNAATSFPKPEAVHEAMMHYARQVGASAGRGAYREAIETGQIIEETRRRIARLIGAERPSSIIMTCNCTDGLSLAIKGILTEQGGHVVTTQMEHNSVLRPLAALAQRQGVEATYVRADGAGLVDPDEIARAVRPDTKLIALVHGSNVCGSVQQVEAVGRLAPERGIVYMVDAAQTIGHLPVDVEAMHVDLLAFPGHKGLLGPLGTGALYIREGLDERLWTLKEGGTGSKSEVPQQPDFMPDKFEAGSHNAIGIAGLCAGVGHVLERGVESIREHERALCEAFMAATGSVAGLKVFGPTDLNKRVGVFSVRVDGYDPAELAAVMEERFGVLTRPGLHCAPFAHQALGTLDTGGTTRLSMGPFLTVEQVHYAAQALVEIAAGQSV